MKKAILLIVIVALGAVSVLKAQCPAPTITASKKINALGFMITIDRIPGVNMYQVRWSADGVTWATATQITQYNTSTATKVDLLIPKLTANGNPFFGIKTGDQAQVAYYCNTISGYPTPSSPVSSFTPSVTVKITN